MPGEDALIRVDDGVLTLTLNRPDKRNAINAFVEAALAEAITRLESERDISVMLISATGSYFSSGFDVGHRVDDLHGSGGVALRRRYRELHDLFDRIERVEKPVVLAAQGPCLGGALELAVSCDFRLVSEQARFSFPETRLAVLPGSGGVSRTTRLVGPAWARWLVLAGRSVDADLGRQIGLVHEVHPTESFDREVQKFVQRLAGLPREAVGLAKLSIDLCDVLDRASGRDLERISNTLLMTSQEHRDQVAALKKRLGEG